MAYDSSCNTQVAAAVNVVHSYPRYIVYITYIIGILSENRSASLTLNWPSNVPMMACCQPFVNAPISCACDSQTVSAYPPGTFRVASKCERPLARKQKRWSAPSSSVRPPHFVMPTERLGSAFCLELAQPHCSFLRIRRTAIGQQRLEDCRGLGRLVGPHQRACLRQSVAIPLRLGLCRTGS